MTEHNDNELANSGGREPAIQAPGLLLKAQRELAGLSHQTVGEALHLTVHYIKALENDDYSKLPGMTFVRGYFRSYARFLNMDVEPILACYEKYVASQGLVTTAGEFAARGRSKSDQAIIWALVAGFILVVALVAGSWFFGRAAEKNQSAATIRVTNSSLSSAARNSQNPLPANDTPIQSVSRQQGASFNQAINPVPENTLDPGAEETTNPAQLLIEAATELEESSANTPADPQLSVNATSETPAATVVLDAIQSLSKSDEVISNETISITAEGTATNTTPPAVMQLDQSEGSVAQGLPGSGNTRQISLLGVGNDFLELSPGSNSWAEIEDANKTSLYNDMLRGGDTLTIRGTAPFYVLLGDARQVAIKYNNSPVQFDTLIRANNTARFELNSSGLTPSANSN